MEYDETTVADVYAVAHRMPPETMATWERAVGRMLPPAARVSPVVDLGCGTGRFMAVLASLYGPPVIGVEPSLRMLGHRESRDLDGGRFVAGRADALPLAAGTAGLVFLSMVYHHLDPISRAIAEIRRVLRPDGSVLVRNPAQESIDAYEYLAFFPEALDLDRRRMPTRAALIEAFAAAGFSPRDHTVVDQMFATSYEEYYRKVALRALSALRLISDEAFSRGLERFEAHCQGRRVRGPVYEPVELFLFGGS